MQQRYYDPLAGWFLSVDPVTTDVETGRSFGRYHYAENNPYRYVDPDGRFIVPVIVVAAQACARSATCVSAGVALMAATGRAISNIIKNESAEPTVPEPKSGSESDEAVRGLTEGLVPAAGGKKGQFDKPGGDAEADLDSLPGDLGILLDTDSSLHAIADLPVQWEAERMEVGSEWIRTRCGAQDA